MCAHDNIDPLEMLYHEHKAEEEKECNFHSSFLDYHWTTIGVEV